MDHDIPCQTMSEKKIRKEKQKLMQVVSQTLPKTRQK